ncbi:hypothetical protein BD311DRAFT_501465 [Dichomitus squalens]|uniref:Uncharacterized protein n=1 Tax=Dichomitus squalens TaxID=114155 RepID=A0A4Q9MHH8_9APHY|nr:hypothetical protein BD311DRAFT_501465 [Dichomitus squalens]
MEALPIPSTPHRAPHLHLVSYPHVASGSRVASYPHLASHPRLTHGDAKLSRKIREACKVARDAGHRYLWIDSCCIDKTSSSELSESINSMYQWYGRAKVCFAHLADVPAGEDPRAGQSAFRRSRWFTRGWTLQELIAPSAVKFLSQDWIAIGTKATLGYVIEEITGIPIALLLRVKSLGDFSVAQRLSWAGQRETSRKEDKAYSLLGIFSINMPTLYGEGDRAFRRLLEEIVRRIPDQSVFAWGRVYADLERDQDLADSLRNARELSCWLEDDEEAQFLFQCGLNDFSDAGMIKVIPHDDVSNQLKLSEKLPAQEYTFTPHGIRTKLPVVPLLHCLPGRTLEQSHLDVPFSQWFLAILGCEHIDRPGALLGRVCCIPPSNAEVEYLYNGWVSIEPESNQGTEGPRLFPLPPTTIERCRDVIQIRTIYISHPERTTQHSEDALCQPHETINLLLSKATRDALRAQGYTADFRHPDEDHPTTHLLTLFCDDYTITIEYWHTLEQDGRRLGVRAHVKMSQRALDSVEEVEEESRSVIWSDSAQWSFSLSLGTKSVTFTLAEATITLKLGLDWAAPSHYFLHVRSIVTV